MPFLMPWMWPDQPKTMSPISEDLVIGFMFGVLIGLAIGAFVILRQWRKRRKD